MTRQLARRLAKLAAARTPSQRAAAGVAVKRQISATTGKTAQRDHGGTAPGKPARTLGTDLSQVSPEDERTSAYQAGALLLVWDGERRRVSEAGA